jgi:DNA-binding transcriptional regulator GbsR (MarR family)
MQAGGQEFAEKAGIFFQSEGLPRIAGRIFGMLLLEEEPQSIDRIAAALRLSKASVSTNARILERWGFLERIGHPGDRRTYYAIASDLAHRTLQLRVERMGRFQSLMADARHLAAPGRAKLRDRLGELVSAYAQTIGAMRKISESWQPRR